MYCDYFGFSKDPFGPEFDASFLFQSKSWTSVYGQLASEIQTNREVLLLTGEDGIGKSYLLRILESRLESQAKFVHQQVDSISYEDFIEDLCIQLALNTENKDLAKKMALLNDYLSAHQPSHVLLVIEDAHLLSDAFLEKIKPTTIPLIQRPISFQIVLTGQPDLKQKYNRLVADDPHSPAFASYALEPLQERECATYIRHRLQSVGDPYSDLFPQSTLDAVWQFTHGIPGSINNLCTAALKSALNTGQKTITAELIRKIAAIGFDWQPERMSSSTATVSIASTNFVQLTGEKEKVLQESLRRKTILDYFGNKAGWYSAVGLVAFISIYLFVLNTSSKPDSVNEIELVGSVQAEQESDKRKRVDFGLVEFRPQQQTTTVSPTPDRHPKETKPDRSFSEAKMQPAIQSSKPETLTTTQWVVQESAPADDNARQYIQKQEAEGPFVNLDEMYKRAQSMNRQNRNSDAYLLYFYAARLGHGDAAFKLGQFNDPATFQDKLNIVESPNPMQAFKWYRKAANAGHPDANRALNRLRTDIEKQASAGDRMAQRRLLQWD